MLVLELTGDFRHKAQGYALRPIQDFALRADCPEITRVMTAIAANSPSAS